MRSNQDVGGAVVEQAGTEYMVRGLGYIKNISDVENIVVGADKKGTPVLIKDVALVRLGPELRRGLAEANGDGEVVGGIVIARFGENARTVIDGVKEKLEELKAGLPPGVRHHHGLRPRRPDQPGRGQPEPQAHRRDDRGGPGLHHLSRCTSAAPWWPSSPCPWGC